MNEKEIKIEKLYYENLSLSEIAKLVNTSISTVSRTIIKYKLSRNKTESLVGKKFGNLKVIEYIKKKRYPNGGVYHIYKCVCDCGDSCYKISGNLKSGKALTCEKCKNKKLSNTLSKGKIPSAIKLRIKYRCKNWGMDSNLTDDFLWNLFLKQKKKCSISGVELILSQKSIENTASLDRIDSSKGYVEGNVQWVHKDINLMKLDHSQNEFIEWCKIVSKNNS